MASSTSRSGDRMIHQDYIARIRYSNTLPPPPNPPKLLDIPNTGLSSGQYTNPGFASRLAREQPLNIEADAELGMPLDLVGMPGIFDGDESSIQASLYPPAPHPHDRALLRPLASLGKPKTSDSGVSFLRRTEYISSHTGKSRFDSTTSRSLVQNTGHLRVKRLPEDIDKESPEYVKAQIEKSFSITAEKLSDPKLITHPTKRNVKLISSLPLLPDLEAFPDAGGYVTVKFQHNPVPPSNIYDTRLDSSILRPLILSDERQAARDDAIALHMKDPERHPFPEPEQNFEFFMVDTPADAARFKRKCDVLDSAREDEDLYTFANSEGVRCFRFKRIREYETAQTVDLQTEKYDDELVIATNEGRNSMHQRAAYYYPVIQRQQIRPQRKRNMDQRRYGIQQQEEEEEDRKEVDFLDVTVRDPDEEETRNRIVWIDDPYHVPDDEEEEPMGQGNDEAGKTDREVHPKNGADVIEGKARDAIDADGDEEILSGS
ncbi:MAG: hypothetical protein M1818_004729 [Claussenomyces sp. TS43310]|nr:MAG: hypothetical protein M1818_004729 [Claussenomyces sp. TS43310]